MSIATEKVKHATERFSLVRIRPARWITGGFVSLGGNLYRYSFGFPVAFSSLELNGTTSGLSKVSGTPGSNGQYQVDEAAGTITLYKSGAAPSASSDHYVAFHYLFLTEKEDREAHETPTDTGTAKRIWSPFLMKTPDVKQSMKNVREGLLTFDNTTIQVANTTAWLQAYLTDDDSFYNAEVIVWQAITDTSNLQKVFTGRISGEGGDQRAVSFTAFETLYAMRNPADLGQGAGSYAWIDSGVFPGHFGLPRHLILAASSWYKTNEVRSGGGYATVRYVVDGLKAACTNYSGTISGTTNRTWGLGMIRGSIPTQSFGTVQAASGVLNDGHLFIRFASYSNINIGDTFKWTSGGTDYYGVIAYVGSFSYEGTSYNIAVFTGPWADPPTHFWSGSPTVTPMKCIGLFARGLFSSTVDYLPYFCLERDYTLTETVDSVSGNRKLSITFVNNAENEIWSVDPLSPSAHEVIYRVSSNATLTHGTVLQLLLEKAGLTVNAAAITAANAALTDTCNFSIPNVDEQEVGPYAKYVGEILRSTLGYISVNASGEVVYKLAALPSSTDARDKNLLVMGATAFSVDYQDMLYGLRYRNPHHPAGVAAPVVTDDYTAKVKYLHGVTRSEEIRHCLELTGSTISRHTQIAALYARPRVVYSWQTATEDIDKALGDDVLLRTKMVLGGGGSKAVKIITVDKQTGRVAVEAEDLTGL